MSPLPGPVLGTFTQLLHLFSTNTSAVGNITLNVQMRSNLEFVESHVTILQQSKDLSCNRFASQFSALSSIKQPSQSLTFSYFLGTV